MPIPNLTPSPLPTAAAAHHYRRHPPPPRPTITTHSSHHQRRPPALQLTHSCTSCAARARPAPQEPVLLSRDNMLLRGCQLRNCSYVLGLVVSTGRETKINFGSKALVQKTGRTVGV